MFFNAFYSFIKNVFLMCFILGVNVFYIYDHKLLQTVLMTDHMTSLVWLSICKSIDRWSN